MKILLVATPLIGHVTPVLRSGSILADGGHEVVAMVPSAFRHGVESGGMRYIPLPGSLDVDWSDIDKAFPQRRTIPPGPAQVQFDICTFFVDPMPRHYAAVQSALAAFPADIVMADMLCPALLPLALGGQMQRPAVAHLGVTVMFGLRENGEPCFLGLPPARDAAEAARYRAIAAEIDAGLLVPVRSRLDGLLAACGAGPLPCPWVDATVAVPDLYLHAAAPSFEYPRTRLPASARFIGALPLPAGGAVPPRVAAARASGKTLVLVTQGTVANTDLTQLIAPTLQALAGREDLLVLATTGGRAVDGIGMPVPANALVLPFLPFDTLMPLVAALVTNGGFGSVTAALAQGVPAVVAGMAEDKPEVAARTAWAGAGIDLRTDRPSPAAIAAAVTAVLTEPAYRAGAQRLARDFARFDARRDLPLLLSQTRARQTA